MIAGELTRLEVLSDVRDVINAAKALPEADGDAPAVALGVSFGGHVALLATAVLRLPRGVAMYAGWLAGTEIGISRPRPTGEFAAVALAESGGRALLLVGEEDPMVPLSDVETVRGWFEAASASLEVVTYPRVGHRFVAEGRPGYDAVAAADAWSRAEHALMQP